MTTPLAKDTSVLSATAPEPGQLVEVRRRHWIVSDVDASAISPELPKSSLVKLASIDEDALGEELEVLWELEPGAHVIEPAGLQASAPATKPRGTKSRTKSVPAEQGALALAEVHSPQATTSKTKAGAPAKKASTQRTIR